jgi:hypothetical protein
MATQGAMCAEPSCTRAAIPSTSCGADPGCVPLTTQSFGTLADADARRSAQQPAQPRSVHSPGPRHSAAYDWRRIHSATPQRNVLTCRDGCAFLSGEGSPYADRHRARTVRHLDPRDVRWLSGLEHCYRTMRRACASVAAGLLGSSAEQGTLVPDQRPFPRSTLTLTGLLFGHLVRPTAHSRRDAPGSQRVLPSTGGGNDARSRSTCQ